MFGGGGGEGRRFSAREKSEGRRKGGKATPPNYPFARALACPNSLSLRMIATQAIVLLRIFLFTHKMAWRSTIRAVAAENKQTKKGKNKTYRLWPNWIFSRWTGYSLVGICVWTSLPGGTRSTNRLTTNWVGSLETKKRTDIISTVLFINSSMTLTSFNSINLSHLHYLHQSTILIVSITKCLNLIGS